MVTDTPLKDAFPRASTLAEADSILSGLAHEEFTELRRLCPDPAVADLFIFGNEFYNCKGHLKAKLAGLACEPVPDGRVTPEAVERLWNGLVTPFDAILAEPIATLRRLVAEPPVDVATLIDWILDGAYLRWASRTARELRAPLIRQYVESFALFRTMAMTWRAQAAGVPMDQFAAIVLTGELDRPELRKQCTADREQRRQWLLKRLPEPVVEAIFTGDERELMDRFDVQIDNYLLRTACEMKAITFGPERVFGYLIAVQRQTHNLRLCLAGQANRIPTELLSGRLRGSYA